MIEFRQTKFWITVAVFVTASAFLAFGVIEEDTWMQVVGWTFSAYVVGNVGATVAHKRETRGGD